MRTRKHASAKLGWQRRSGFTLVELLTVIAIIGIIAGMLVPAVMYAFRTAQGNALAMEVTTIAGAVDKYKEKYGDYPPDGSSATAMRRHLRKIFPQIAETELRLLNLVPGATNPSFPPLCNSSTGISGSVMDGPEALVFFLGGFSDDPVHPFSGAGGPFDSSTGVWQYRVARNSPLYEFNQGQLSLDTSSGITISNDEEKFDFARPAGFTGDMIPVYSPSGRNAPFVYFNSNTYVVGGAYNFYQGLSSDPNAVRIGAARPYKSDQKNTLTPTDLYRYAEDQTFQVISAGLDDDYGGFPTLPNVEPLFFRFPSGDSLRISDGATPVRTMVVPDEVIYEFRLPFQYNPPSGSPVYLGQLLNINLATQLDNSTNFSEGTLEDSMP